MQTGPYNALGLKKQLDNQKKHNWCLETGFDWSSKIDTSKTLAPLDHKAFFFPYANSQERLAIGQMMGLVIARCIVEMEETLIRLRPYAMDALFKKHLLGPELEEMGHQFFEEELKHSMAFDRYLNLYTKELGVEKEELFRYLPSIENGLTEKALKADLMAGGMAFWWIVAIVEQEFLTLYKAMKPHKGIIEPLYFDIHEKHFYEEVRHASFPFYILQIAGDFEHNPFKSKIIQGSLKRAQVTQGIWAVSQLKKGLALKKKSSTHPFFENLSSALNTKDHYGNVKKLWMLFTETPYISTLINPLGQKKITEFSQKLSAGGLSFFECSPSPLVGE